MALSRSSLEYLSIFYYLKDGVLPSKFSQEVQGAPLVYDAALQPSGAPRTDYFVIDPSSAFASLATSRGRGLLSFELTELDPCKIYNVDTGEYVPIYNTPFEQSSFIIPTEREATLINVRDQNNIILPRDYYELDYRQGRVRWPCPTTPSGALTQVPKTIDYRFHLVSLLNGWADDETPIQSPTLAFYPLSEKNAGIQIGPGVKSINRYAIDIFGTNEAELQEVLTTLKTALYNRSIPVIDFNRTGEPLEHWGVINKNFIQEVTYQGTTYRTYLTLNPGNGNVLYFLNIEAMYSASKRQSRSDLVRHLGKLTFTTETLTDRDPRLVGKFSMLNEPPGGFDSLISS